MPNEKNQTRSVKCNGRLLAQYRKNAGFTQATLAAKAGFTERLISKAESSKMVSVQTLQILVQTLSEAGANLSYKDLATDPVALAREFIEGMYHHQAGVIDATSHFLHPDCVFFFSGDPAVFPFAGWHHGLDAGRRAFETFFSILEPPKDLSELEAWNYLPTDTGAFAWGDSWIHPIGQPLEHPIKVAVKNHFENGLLTSWEDLFDTQAGAAVIEAKQQTKSYESSD